MATNYDDLSKKYDGFKRPTVELNINSKKMDSETMIIRDLEVMLSTGLEASICRIAFSNQYDISTGSFNDDLVENVLMPGHKIEVKLGYISTETVFVGYIDTIRLSFTESSAPMVYIECLDAKGMMMHGIKSVSYAKASYADIAQTLISNYSSFYNKLDVASGTKMQMAIQQNNETDYAFICRMARTINYEFYVLNGTVIFKKSAQSDAKTIMTMGMNELLTRFNVVFRMAEFVNKVTVKGYNDLTHEAVIGIAQKAGTVGEGSAITKYAKALSNTETVLLDYEINTEEEAKERAQAELDRRSMAFVTGKGRSLGIPEIVPGAYIEIKKFDDTVDNKYYVTKVTHKFNKGNYYTEFEAGANRK